MKKFKHKTFAGEKMVNSHHFRVMVKIQVTVLHPTHPEMIGEDFIGIETDFISS